MKFKGIKGEGRIDPRAALRVINEKGLTIASTSSGQSGDNREEEIANAKLIATAPELLEFAMEMAKRYPNSPWISERANEIIKKALG